MQVLGTLQDQLNDWYESDLISGTDIATCAQIMDYSKVTVWQYIRKNGKNINTAESIYNYFKSVVDRRIETAAKIEIIKDAAE
jgi:hypothetical protein